MNKLTIPAILAVTVMVAGIFAFMPVEQASTVHTSGTITISAATIALVADEMFEVREISVTDVDFDGAQAITITGAAATDEFQVLSLIVVPGTGGTPIAVTDEINIDGLTIDGAIGFLTANTDDDVTATGIEYINLLDINPPTGNVIGFEMSPGTAAPTDGETISVTAKISIRNSAADPVITTE